MSLGAPSSVRVLRLHCLPSNTAYGHVVFAIRVRGSTDRVVVHVSGNPIICTWSSFSLFAFQYTYGHLFLIAIRVRGSTDRVLVHVSGSPIICGLLFVSLFAFQYTYGHLFLEAIRVRGSMDRVVVLVHGSPIICTWCSLSAVALSSTSGYLRRNSRIITCSRIQVLLVQATHYT